MARAPAPNLVRRLRQSLGILDRREPGLVNHISLGSHCHMAQILKGAGLRTWSGPFDWIFSSPAMVLDCLADDFAALLDRSHYESTPPDRRPAPHEWSCRHRLYAERHAIPFVFNHHDPATNEADYRFLGEGIRRLRRALALGEANNRFYVLTSLPTPDDTVLALSDRLADHGGTNRLLFVQSQLGFEATRVETLPSDRANLTWVRAETRSASVGVRFADPADDAAIATVVRGFAHGS